jgi:hypothetical protein
MVDRVHEVVNAFMLSNDFLEGRALVEQLKDELLSDASLAYIDRQLAHAENGSPLHNLLLLKGRALHDCRDMSVNYAFARMLLEVDPGDVSPEVAQRIAGARSPGEIERLAQERPDLIAQVSRAARLRALVRVRIRPSARARTLDSGRGRWRAGGSGGVG